MGNLLKPVGVIVCILVIASCATYAPLELHETKFTRVQVSEDYEAFLAFVKSTHPNLEYSADIAALDTVAAQVRQSFHDEMTLREAWTAMAVTNPVFGDAHIGLLRPVKALADYEKNGGMLFPAPVIIGDDGVIRIAGNVSKDIGVNAGDELISINGVSSSDIVAHLSPRMRGESAALRRLVMERRFPQYFWISYGGFDRYVVRVNGARGTRSVTLRNTADLELGDALSPYNYEKLAENVGYLDVPTFEKQHLDQFKTFVETAFAQIADDDVDALIIDLRRNGGGAHDVSDLLMAYLTDKPFSATSGITARVTEENIGRLPGAELGAVVTVPFQQIVNPPEKLANRFSGKVYALIGALTYSQAIVFASTLQDYEIATIAGEKTEGPANQTGQVQAQSLPNTGLQALAPIYIFTRASGDTSRQGIVPDIAIENDPLDTMSSVHAMLEML